MIKLDELLEQWTKDCVIDESNIKREITNIPKLHAKYIRFLNEHKLASFKAKFDYDKMKNIRTEYYLGQLDQETLEAYEWDQFDIHVTKTGVEKYINSDEILIKLLQKKIYYDQIVSTCESILNELKSRTWQMKTLVDYEKFLRSVISGFCPTCNNPIEVYTLEESDNSFCFNYLCGHSWKGITIEETISVSELIKTKTARSGFGWLRKTTQGHKQSGDPKLKKGVEVYMDVNREKNEYHQVVTNNETKEILHEEHEPLTEHRSKDDIHQKQ